MKRYLLSVIAMAAVIAAMTSTSSCKTSADSGQKAYVDSVANNIAQLQLKHRKFVLTADRITINHSPIINVSDNTNFILVDTQTGVVQISPRIGGGPNSLGGITVTGDISNYEMKTAKNGDVTVTYRLSAPVGSTDVRILLYKGSNKAEATVNATFNRSRATLNGEIKALGADYFQGRSF